MAVLTEGEYSISEITEKYSALTGCNIPPSTVHIALQRCEEIGYVKSRLVRVSNHAKLRTHYRLTASGKRVFKRKQQYFCRLLGLPQA